MRIETILRYFLINIVPIFRFSTYACINTIYNFFQSNLTIKKQLKVGVQFLTLLPRPKQKFRQPVELQRKFRCVGWCISRVNQHWPTKKKYIRLFIIIKELGYNMYLQSVLFIICMHRKFTKTYGEVRLLDINLSKCSAVY